MKGLAALRDRLASRLGQLGLLSRELTVEEVRRLHYESLNPTASRFRPDGPAVALREDVFPNYTQDGFERAFGERFDIQATEQVKDSDRIMYLMRARK